MKFGKRYLYLNLNIFVIILLSCSSWAWKGWIGAKLNFSESNLCEKINSASFYSICYTDLYWSAWLFLHTECRSLCKLLREKFFLNLLIITEDCPTYGSKRSPSRSVRPETLKNICYTILCAKFTLKMILLVNEYYIQLSVFSKMFSSRVVSAKHRLHLIKY